MRIRFYIYAAMFALLFAGLHCFRLWQPERQIVLHTEHLLKAVGKRDWTGVARFVDESYADRWGHDKASAIGDARDAFQQFFSLSIAPESPSGVADRTRGVVTARLKLGGSGTAVAQSVKNYLNGLHAPFTFEWRRKSWKPWDWQLVRMDNAELEIDKNLAL